MKNRFFTPYLKLVYDWFFCFFFAVMGLLLFSQSPLACELKIGWEQWPPYQYRDDNGDVTGLDIELISSAMKGSGCRLLFFEIEWMAHLKRLESGFLDVALAASYTAERQKFGYYSDPYRMEVVRLYVRKGETGTYKLETLADITGHGFVLGITSGNYYGEEFERLKKNSNFAAHLEPVRNDNRNFLKIREYRIDGFLMDPFVVSALIRSHEIESPVEVYPVEVYSCDIHALFSRVSVDPGVVDLFNRGLSRLKATGKYEAIVNHYLNQ